MAYTPNERAIAVARVLAGESQRKVAREMGVGDGTVRRWMAQAERRETAQAQSLAEQAQEIAGEIKRWEDIARHRLIRRIAEVAPRTEDLAQLASAYAKVTEKAMLAKKQPTAITATQSDFDREVAELVEKVRQQT